MQLLQQPISRQKRLLFTAMLALLTLFVCAGLYLSTIVLRSAMDYAKHKRWIGSAYASDERYGYFPKPYELAYHSLQYGERIPVLFDENGFRIPISKEQPEGLSDFRILFLGESMTHGYGVPAEKTFAYLTAKELHASAMNAGGSAWGLSQMVMRAKDVIPKLKPDIVVVQYSSWLPERSMVFYGPTRWGKTPGPYFYESDDMIDIHQPVFQSINFKLPISKYAGKGLIPFVWHVGLPLFVHDDYMVLSTFLKSRLGLLPLPTASRQKSVDFAYNEIQRLCKANGANTLMLVIPDNIDDLPKDRLDSFTFPVVDTLAALARKLPEPTREAWAANYYFWRGNPPRIVDKHPNARLHAAIAEILVEAIRQSQYENKMIRAELGAPANAPEARR